MDTCVSAVQHLRRMRGGSQSHLLRASDGAHYVTKFMNNPQHVRVLANEMLATNLGLRLGLPMPRVEVIDVSDRLIENTDDLRVEVAGASIPCSSGRQLASLYAGGMATAGITFVAAHFDGSGDDGVTEEVKCYDSDAYAYEECEPVAHEASDLQEHFEALVPYGYENDAGGFGDVVLDVHKRKITVERNDRFEDYSTTTYEV